MREIKFRALKNGSWWYSDDEAYNLKEYDGVLYLCEDVKFYINTEEYELEIIGVAYQYTGLKDKNGVEIYEGDYLLDSHSGGRGEVKFYKGAFIVEFDNEMQDLYDWTYEYVIGNIKSNLSLSLYNFNI